MPYISNLLQILSFLFYFSSCSLNLVYTFADSSNLTKTMIMDRNYATIVTHANSLSTNYNIFRYNVLTNTTAALKSNLGLTFNISYLREVKSYNTDTSNLYLAQDTANSTVYTSNFTNVLRTWTPPANSQYKVSLSNDSNFYYDMLQNGSTSVVVRKLYMVNDSCQYLNSAPS